MSPAPERRRCSEDAAGRAAPVRKGLTGSGQQVGSRGYKFGAAARSAVCHGSSTEGSALSEGIAEVLLLAVATGLQSRRRRRERACPAVGPEAGSWGAEKQLGGRVVAVGDLSDVVSKQPIN